MQRGTVVPQPTYPGSPGIDHSGATPTLTGARTRAKSAGEVVFVLAMSGALLVFWHHMVMEIPVSFWGIPLDWSIMSLAQPSTSTFGPAKPAPGC